jgi:hypothetical protein
MTDIARRLADELHSAVAARFDGLVNDAASSSTRLLFAAVGRAVDPQQLDQPTSAGTREATSTFVDCLPAPGTTFIPQAGTFSDAYESLVTFARPRDSLPEDVAATVTAQIAMARKRFDHARLGRLGAAVQYVPTEQDPPRWFDAAGLHWTHLAVSDQSAPPTEPPAPDSPAPSWDFRVPDSAASLDAWVHALPGAAPVALEPVERRLLASRELRLVAAEPASRAFVPMEPSPRALRGSPGLRLEPQPIGIDALPLQHRNLSAGMRLLSRPEILQRLVEETSPVPTTSSSFSLELDYVLVNLQRVWLQTGWLESDEWHIPGFEPGEVSAGNPVAAGQQLPAFPVGFIAVKNVLVRAEWSEADTANLASAAGIGPFGMVGGGFSADAGTLAIPGVQAMAWLCQVPPKLPPDPPSAA